MKVHVLVKHLPEPTDAWRHDQDGSRCTVLDDDRWVIPRIENSRTSALPAELPVDIRRPLKTVVSDTVATQ